MAESARAGKAHVGADALVRSAQQLVTVIGSLALAARTRRPGLRWPPLDQSPSGLCLPLNIVCFGTGMG